MKRFALALLLLLAAPGVGWGKAPSAGRLLDHIGAQLDMGRAKGVGQLLEQARRSLAARLPKEPILAARLAVLVARSHLLGNRAGECTWVVDRELRRLKKLPPGGRPGLHRLHFVRGRCYLKLAGRTGDRRHYGVAYRSLKLSARWGGRPGRVGWLPGKRVLLLGARAALGRGLKSDAWRLAVRYLSGPSDPRGREQAKRILARVRRGEPGRRRVLPSRILRIIRRHGVQSALLRARIRAGSPGKPGKTGRAPATSVRAKASAAPGQLAVSRCVNRILRTSVRAGGKASTRSWRLCARLCERAPRGVCRSQSALIQVGLGNSLLAAGEHRAALVAYRRAFASTRGLRAREHPWLAVFLNNMAVLHARAGDHRLALQAFRRAAQIWRARPGTRARSALAENNAGECLARLGDKSGALVSYRRALGAAAGLRGDRPRVEATILGNIGTAQLSLGQRSPAEKAFVGALSRWAREGSSSPGRVESLMGLGRVRVAQGRAQEGLKLLARALKVWRTARVRSPKLGADILGHTALALEQMGRSKAALAAARRAFGLARRGALGLFSVASETARLDLAAGLSRWRDLYLSLAAATLGTGKDVPRKLMGMVLASKGLVSDFYRLDRRRVCAGSKGKVHRLCAALRVNTAQTTRLFARLRTSLTSAMERGLQGKLSNLRLQRSRLEIRLALASAGGKRPRVAAVTVARLCRSLPSRSSLVEYVLYRGTDRRMRYLALVVNRSGCVVRAFRLGLADRINRAVSAWRRSISPPTTLGWEMVTRLMAAEPRHAARLASWVLAPIMASIPKGLRRMIVAPDGALSLIPFEALITKGKRRLVERATLAYVTSGRDVVGVKRPKLGPGRLVIYAAPEYGRPEGLLAARGGKVGRGGRTRSGSGTRALPIWAPLPYTRDEAADVRRTASAAGLAVTLRMGNAATERLFFSDARRARYIHLATHGFFLDEHLEGKGRRRLGPTGLSWLTRPGSPLALSGVVLAGANRRRTGASSGQGWLTAEKLSGMSLFGVDLVVLSACETALGVVSRGEGVFGLRRALLGSGVRSVVMTLWRVSDRYSRELMRTFYQELLTRRRTPGEALRRAKAAMMAKPCCREPWYWAGYVLAGSG